MNELNPVEQLVYDSIPRGIENAKTFKEMNLNLRYKRDFYRIVESLRNKGKIIGAIRSRDSGYYVATNEDEKEQAIVTFEAQPKKELKTASRMRKAELEEIA